MYMGDVGGSNYFGLDGAPNYNVWSKQTRLHRRMILVGYHMLFVRSIL